MYSRTRWDLCSEAASPTTPRFELSSLGNSTMIVGGGRRAGNKYCSRRSISFALQLRKLQPLCLVCAVSKHSEVVHRSMHLVYKPLCKLLAKAKNILTRYLIWYSIYIFVSTHQLDSTIDSAYPPGAPLFSTCSLHVPSPASDIILLLFSKQADVRSFFEIDKHHIKLTLFGRHLGGYKARSIIYRSILY